MNFYIDYHSAMGTCSDILCDCSRVVSFDGVKAEIIEADAGIFDILLCINSQKFFIRMTDECGCVGTFEILSAKGFIGNLTNSLIITLRSLVCGLISW